MHRLRSAMVVTTLVVIALALLVALAGAQEVAPAPIAPPPAPSTFTDVLDAGFRAWVVDPLSAFIFFDVVFWDDAMRVPLVVLWLACSALFFTLRLRFVNVRAFRHALEITAGQWDAPHEKGEVTHFQALASALSGTIGLGNIAGVAIAMSLGGPGAMVWMTVAGFLGMTSKMVECTLGMLYREIDAQGRVSGGPMHYLEAGLRELAMPRLGKALAITFAVLCIGGSLGGGNMFQANQAFAQVASLVPLFEGRGWLFGLALAALVGIVILGGIKRIGRVAEALVPAMCVLYTIGAIAVLVVNAERVPDAIVTIVREAFSPRAGIGGLVGVLVVGFQRAGFSNEAGIGSASIAHSAATTGEPVREGIVALLEPFIDTIVICNTTALVVVVSGVLGEPGATGDGVLLTSRAFATVMPWFPWVLSLAVLLFAYATMLSWSYYGERCATWLLGARIGPERASLAYKILFLACTVLGASLHLGSVLDFSDLMILGMAFPNVVGLVLLLPRVTRALDDYWARYRGGTMTRPR
ncbi:alanine/glycine:cation symporter family protein [Sandaracinus amylolyticus]|uniref:alanine/glycine:cation symporter family protein n=1 Tax=Sandaracinus amylolyticus TaxID=927083 RepID=UPI001F34153F|nr:alanine/glycine:cation symporter family protein [Sandaracinus amylolyticus]